jgi:Uma2 family endonuclease
MQTVITASQYEIERGKPIPSKNHAFVQTRLIVAFATQFTQYQVLSELSLQLGTSEKVPDLAIFENIKFTPGNDEIRVEQIPLTVIEILSYNGFIEDLIANKNAYFENGIGSYWLVLPDLKSIYVFSSPFESEVYTHKDILKDEILGIELELKGIFG